MLNFDLHQTPPSAEEIAAERKVLEKRRAKYQWLTVVGVLAVIVAVVVAVIIGVIVGGVVGVIAGVIVGGVVAGAVAVIVDRAATSAKARIDRVGESLSILADISPTACEQLIADCLADPDCEQYRQKVAAMGRKPVVAEAEMIREWVANADAREKARREGIACALVASREPLPSEAVAALKPEGGKPC